MSDNLPKDLCEHQMKISLHAYLDIPTEVWTDVFMLLPRRTLVQRVQPVNKVFKAICDRNIKSIHVIGNIDELMWWRLCRNKPKEQRPLEALAGNNCPLAGHFRMTNVKIYYNGSNEGLAALRHSLDLFRHCQLTIIPRDFILRSPYEPVNNYQLCLALLEPAKPSYIEMRVDLDMDLKLKVFDEFLQTRLNELLRHPTTLNCSRLKLSGFNVCGDREAVFNWLHHRVDVEEEHGEEVVRCLNLDVSVYKSREFNQWLFEQCIRNFEQSKVTEDRRCFALTFNSYWNGLDNFVNRNNPTTGEVLLFERVLLENGPGLNPYESYRLLRCSAHRVANNGKEQLYAKLFKSTSDFKLERQDVAKVRIS